MTNRHVNKPTNETPPALEAKLETGNLDMNALSRRFVPLFLYGLLAHVLGSTAFCQLSSLPALPWPDGRVTISFAPDEVEIGRYRNELSLHLDNQLGNPDWKIEILRAFQAWARHSGLRVALSPDSPRAFGVPGLAQGDPRFGDIRLGAFPQTEVLGNAVFFHPSSGVWAGDIFLDTNRTFVIDHGSAGAPGPEQYDLFSVLLHEAGNSLGLVDEEYDPDSVMFFAYLGTRSGLSLGDINRIQQLYGPPSPDPWEGELRNDYFATATPIKFATSFPRSLVETVNGRIQNSADVDFYRFSGTTLAENCWVKLRARERSLLCGRIRVFDGNFQEIASIEAEDPIRNSVGKEITGILPGQTIFVAIDWSGVPDFEFGDYELALDFNQNAGDEFAEPNDDDDEPLDFFEADDEGLVDVLYSMSGLIDPELNANDTFASAVELFSARGLPPGTRFELISSLATAADRDVYRIQTAADASGTMAINLNPLGLESARFNLTVYDAAKRVVLVTQRFRVDGDLVIEAQGIQPNSIYYLQVTSNRRSSNAGNYLLLAQVGTKAPELENVQEVLLSATEPDQFGEFTTAKTQLFRFDLSMSSADSQNQACQLTVYSETGRVELVTSVVSGGNRRAYVWLQAGTHYFRFSAKTRRSRSIVPSIVRLDGASISDDEGPILLDPSGNPISGPQQPGANPTPPPIWLFPRFAVGLIVPPENPW